MSGKNKLRTDKTCLNCNHVVEKRYCSNCGQENIDSRKSFYELFVHFFEDLTHYENAFWKTIKNLITKPASLTKEYLSGKRMSYLAPIRLYIFISFVTFLTINILDSTTEEHELEKSKPEKETLSSVEKQIIELQKSGEIGKKEADSLLLELKTAKELKKEKYGDGHFFNTDYKTIEELEKDRNLHPEKFNALEYWFLKKSIPIHQKYTNKEIKDKFFESLTHNIPKSLFLYMPLFAFALWLFHGKKKWYYFDHGIFTLHYFSFLLLMILISVLIGYIFSYFDNWFFTSLVVIINFGLFIWTFYYFFPAHHRFYGESRTVSFFKSLALLFINFFLILFILIGLVIYSFINIH